MTSLPARPGAGTPHPALWLLLLVIMLLLMALSMPARAATPTFRVDFDNAETGNKLTTGWVYVQAGNATAAKAKINADLRQQFGKDLYNATAVEKSSGEYDQYLLWQYYFLLPSQTVIIYGVTGETQPKPDPETETSAKVTK